MVNVKRILIFFLYEGGIIFDMEILYYSSLSEKFVIIWKNILFYIIFIRIIIGFYKSNMELFEWREIIY